MTLREEGKLYGITFKVGTKREDMVAAISKAKAIQGSKPDKEVVEPVEVVIPKMEATEAPLPPIINGNNYENKKEITKRKLAKEPKRNVFIPLEPGEKKGTYITVKINGYPFHIVKNADVEVPMSVAKLVRTRMGLSDTGQIETSAKGGGVNLYEATPGTY